MSFSSQTGGAPEMRQGLPDVIRHLAANKMEEILCVLQVSLRRDAPLKGPGCKGALTKRLSLGKKGPASSPVSFGAVPVEAAVGTAHASSAFQIACYGVSPRSFDRVDLSGHAVLPPRLP